MANAYLNEITIHTLTADRWMDLEALFGPRGACSGCWCMWWRIKRSEFACSAGEQKRLAFKAIVESGKCLAFWHITRDHL